MENWKTVEGFEAYEVSDLGRVRRRLSTGHGTKVGKILKQSPDGGGYLHVKLCREGRASTTLVHRLVAEAFIPNPLGLPEVNHTGKQTDNRAEKLEWLSTAKHALDKMQREQIGDGVALVKTTGRYRAAYSPKVNTREDLGMFDTYEEALAARRAAVGKL